MNAKKSVSRTKLLQLLATVDFRGIALGEAAKKSGLSVSTVRKVLANDDGTIKNIGSASGLMGSDFGEVSKYDHLVLKSVDVAARKAADAAAAAEKKAKQVASIRELSVTLDNSLAELNKLCYDHLNTDHVYVVAWEDGINAFRTSGAEIAMVGKEVWTSISKDAAERVAAQLTAKSKSMGADRDGVIAMTLTQWADKRREWIATMKEQFAEMELKARG